MANEIVKQDTIETITIPDGAFNTVDITTFDGAVTLTNAINNSKSLNDFVFASDLFKNVRKAVNNK
jgi:hypothetical protein